MSPYSCTFFKRTTYAPHVESPVGVGLGWVRWLVPPLLNDVLGGKLLAPLGVLLSLCLGLVA